MRPPQLMNRTVSPSRAVMVVIVTAFPSRVVPNGAVVRLAAMAGAQQAASAKHTTGTRLFMERFPLLGPGFPAPPRSRARRRHHGKPGLPLVAGADRPG